MEICRACNTNLSLQPLFDHKLNYIFETLTTIQLFENDNLPAQICINCAALLNEFDSFKNMCLTNDKLLKEYPGSSIKLKNEKTTFGSFDGDPNITNQLQEDNEYTTSVLKTILDTNHGNEDVLSEVKMEDPLSCDDGSAIPEDYDEDTFSDDSILNDEEHTRIIPPVQLLSKQERKNKKLLEKVNYNNITTYEYKCDICNRGFHHFERFEGHLREHSGKKPAVCQYCGQDFTWSGLGIHIKKVHPKETESKCHICNQICVNDSAMQAHLSIHNRRQRQFVCETCGQVYQDSYQLKCHLAIHQTETPFECDRCGKKFKRKGNLQAHTYRHEGIKKFDCEMCTKSFSTRAGMRKHQRFHKQKKKITSANRQKMVK